MTFDPDSRIWTCPNDNTLVYVWNHCHRCGSQCPDAARIRYRRHENNVIQQIREAIAR